MENSMTLSRLADLQAWVEHGGLGVDRTISISDFVSHLNRAFNNNNPAAYAIPGTSVS
jgi:hypothetical protein